MELLEDVRWEGSKGKTVACRAYVTLSQSAPRGAAISPESDDQDNKKAGLMARQCARGGLV